MLNAPVPVILYFRRGRASISETCCVAAKLRESKCMKLTINGEPRDFDSPLSLSALVQEMGMKQDRVAIERNRDIVPRAQWDDTQLTDGDQLEIVHFVGGGRAEN
jgi:sulfur carrier protein